MAYRELSDFEKGRIVGMLEAGFSQREVARRLCRNHKTVAYWWNRWQETGSIERKEGRGRHSLHTERMDRTICHSIRQSRFKSYRLQRQQNLALQRLSLRSLQRRAMQLGFRAFRPIIRIPLTPLNRSNRLIWCNERLHWSNENWQKVVFSDESRFCLDMQDGRVRVRRQITERFLDCCIVQHHQFGGGSIMVWAAMSSQQLSPLIMIDGTLNGEKYAKEIIEKNVVPFMKQHNNFWFQHDNARPHVCKVAIAALKQNNINTIPWPSRSPDLSIIEHLWDVLGKRLQSEYAEPPTSLESLKHRLKEQWNLIPFETVKSLFDSMPRRIAECAEKNGGHTSY